MRCRLDNQNRFHGETALKFPLLEGEGSGEGLNYEAAISLTPALRATLSPRGEGSFAPLARVGSSQPTASGRFLQLGEILLPKFHLPPLVGFAPLVFLNTELDAPDLAGNGLR